MTETQTDARIHLQGIGSVPAVPLRDVKAGDRLMWNYGGTCTVVRVTPVTAKTAELVERDDKGREYTRRKRLDTLVCRLAPLHRRWTRVLTNSPLDRVAKRDMVGWVGVSDATLRDFERGLIHGRRIEADGFCTNDCPGCQA